MQRRRSVCTTSKPAHGRPMTPCMHTWWRSPTASPRQSGLPSSQRQPQSWASAGWPSRGCLDSTARQVKRAHGRWMCAGSCNSTAPSGFWTPALRRERARLLCLPLPSRLPSEITTRLHLPLPSRLLPEQLTLDRRRRHPLSPGRLNGRQGHRHRPCMAHQ